MLALSRRALAALAVFSFLSATPGIWGHAVADDQDLADALRSGGLVIVVRHDVTFPDQADTDPLNFDNIAAQRISTTKARR